MPDLAAAVIGTGFMGPTHTEALRRLGVQVLGILGSSPEKSQRAAESLSIETAYDNYESVLADDSIQVIHITTPNRFHFDQASRALKAGKHVLCEKPLAMTARESSKLVELAGESSVAAGVNYNIRYYPLNIEVRNRIQTGELGKINSVVGSYVQDWLLYPTDYNWRVLADEGGLLRAVADIGTHWLDLVQAMTGLEVESVCANLKTVHPVRQRPKGEVETFSGKIQDIESTESVDIQTDDSGAVLLRFKGGAHGSLWVSQVTSGRKNCLRYEIAGGERSVAWNSEQPNNLWIGHRNEPNQSLIRDPGLVSEAARDFITYPGGHNEGYDDSFKQCFKAFYDYISTGDLFAPATFPTFADGHKEIVLCEAILKSHQEEKWITV